MDRFAEVIVYTLMADLLVIQLVDDRDGERRKKSDVIVLSILAAIQSLLIHYYLHIEWYRTIAAAFAWHFLLFDYIVVVLLVKNKVIRADAKWFTYMGHGTIDSVKLWRDHPYFRLIVRVAVFVIANAIYFRWSLLVWSWLKSLYS